MVKFLLVVYSIALGVMTSACGRAPVLDLGQFEPYVDKFQDQAKQSGLNVKVTDLIIRFGQMEKANERGACKIVGDATPVITIKQETWNKIDESEREQLIFHELGHCVLKRHHREDVMTDGLPASIMNPYKINGPIYAEHRTYYISELYEHMNEF